MKNKLEVSLKIQPDGKTVVTECTHIDEELRGKGVLAEKGEYRIESVMYPKIYGNAILTRGTAKENDYLVTSHKFNTPQEAQEYVNIMNELIAEVNNPKTDWRKVEEGTEVRIIGNSLGDNLVFTFKAKFLVYIPRVNKIVVETDGFAEMIDEDKVELC